MLTIYEVDYFPRICGGCYIAFVGSSCQRDNLSVVDADTVGVQQVDTSEARWAMALVYIVTISANLWAAPASMYRIGKTVYGEDLPTRRCATRIRTGICKGICEVKMLQVGEQERLNTQLEEFGRGRLTFVVDNATYSHRDWERHLSDR